MQSLIRLHLQVVLEHLDTNKLVSNIHPRVTSSIERTERNLNVVRKVPSLMISESLLRSKNTLVL
jgi:hypothetical protein